MQASPSVSNQEGSYSRLTAIVPSLPNDKKGFTMTFPFFILSHNYEIGKLKTEDAINISM